MGLADAPSEHERHAWIPPAVESLAYSGHPGRSAVRDRLASWWVELRLPGSSRVGGRRVLSAWVQCGGVGARSGVWSAVRVLMTGTRRRPCATAPRCSCLSLRRDYPRPRGQRERGTRQQEAAAHIMAPSSQRPHLPHSTPAARLRPPAHPPPTRLRLMIDVNISPRLAPVHLRSLAPRL